jgi:hypothetical protein
MHKDRIHNNLKTKLSRILLIWISLGPINKDQVDTSSIKFPKSNFLSSKENLSNAKLIIPIQIITQKISQKNNSLRRKKPSKIRPRNNQKKLIKKPKKPFIKT